MAVTTPERGAPAEVDDPGHAHQTPETMRERRTHRYRTRTKRQQTAQVATIIMLVGVLAFVLTFKDVLARSMSALLDAFDGAPSSDVERPGAATNQNQPGTSTRSAP